MRDLLALLADNDVEILGHIGNERAKVQLFKQLSTIHFQLHRLVVTSLCIGDHGVGDEMEHLLRSHGGKAYLIGGSNFVSMPASGLPRPMILPLENR